MLENEIVEEVFYNAVVEIDIATEDSEESDGLSPVFPNDSWNDSSWCIQVPDGSNWGMEAINAPSAWAYLDHMETVRIGLIDEFPNVSHADLNFAGTFINGEGVNADNTSSNDQHGTHVAGTMAATMNNSIGVTGVMGTRGELYFSASSTNTFYTAMQYLVALRALIDNDVRVINISQNTSRLIGFAASRGNANAINHLQYHMAVSGNALNRMINNGYEFIICVAAGNNNNTTYYPNSNTTFGYSENPTFLQAVTFSRGDSGDSQALYNNFLSLIDIEAVRDRIVVVGSIGIDSRNSSDNKTRFHYSAFSNIGDRVDIVGPGEGIYSTVVNGYDYKRGTSMATPHVAGVAGLIFASNPNLSGAEVKRILLNSTTEIFHYTGGSSGLVNAEMAVIQALQTQTQPVSTVLENPLKYIDGDGNSVLAQCICDRSTSQSTEEPQESIGNDGLGGGNAPAGSGDSSEGGDLVTPNPDLFTDSDITTNFLGLLEGKVWYREAEDGEYLFGGGGIRQEISIINNSTSHDIQILSKAFSKDGGIYERLDVYDTVTYQNGHYRTTNATNDNPIFGHWFDLSRISEGIIAVSVIGPSRPFTYYLMP